MKRSVWTLTAVVCLVVLVALPVLAAGPNVSKRVLGEGDGKAVVLLRVTASGQDIYGVNIKDASGSISDIVAPKGWVGITSGDDVIFRTGGKPIKAGSSMSFRIVTSNKDGALSVSFRDNRSAVGESKSL